MIPVQADIEQGECIRRDPAPYEPITYRVPLDADLQQYTAEMCDLYEVPLELAYAVMQVESGYTVSATSSTGDYGLMQINSMRSRSLESRSKIPRMNRETTRLCCRLLVRLTAFLRLFAGTLRLLT